jgi:helicase
MYKSMKIKNLKNYGIPSYIVNIWEKHYSRYLLPVQEEAVRNYGILDCGGNEEGRMQYAPTEGNDREEGSTGLPRRSASRNDKREDVCNDPSEVRLHGAGNKNLLVIAPPSSGKSFLGEMATIAHLIHQKKCIYLTPFRCYAEEKYCHFKNLYSKCGVETIISTRNRKENDCRLIQGDYKLAVMDCEKFNYFLLMYPELLTDVSLVIVDEMQIIDDPQWGPLLEEIIDQLLKKDLANLRIIALSALIENQDILLKWFPAHPLISYPQPVEMRKGVVREGVFKYTTLKEEKDCQREVFFKPEVVRDNCFEDYLLETVKYFIKKDEPTLIFFATPAESRQWARWLASQLKSPAASSVIKELHQMEDTLSRNELLELLEKGVAYHNSELFWEEKNLVETYLKKREIKIVCASIEYSIGINLPFKNIIIPLDKIHNNNGNYLRNYRTGLSFSDIENMGGRAGTLDFGRIIFLGHSLLAETIHQNTYSNSTQDSNKHKTANRWLIKSEKELLTYLLRLSVKHKLKSNEIKEYLKEGATHLSGYWHFSFDKESIEKKIDRYLNILKGNKLLKEIKGGILSPTANGILITALKIKVETYLFLKYWMGYCKKGEISELEILLLLAFSADGKVLPIPFSQVYKNDDHRRGNYWNKILHLVFKQGDEDKKLYQDKIMFKKIKEDSISLENYLTFKKTCLLHDWIKGDKDIKTIEQENRLHGGVIQELGEGFSWLADSLMEITKNEGWRKVREEDLNKIKILSKRLIDGVEEEGLNLSSMHIPGLSRYYINRLVGAGYNNGKCLKKASEEELDKILPKRLVKRIQKRMKEENNHQAVAKAKWIVQDEKLKAYKKVSEECGIGGISKRQSTDASPVTLLEPVLEISQRRPDRIIFMGKKIELTSTEFSLIRLLAQHNGQVMSYDELLDELWKDEKDAIYNRVSFHISKIRRNILKTIGEIKINEEKVKDIFVVVPKRGVILKLKAEEIKIN